MASATRGRRRAPGRGLGQLELYRAPRDLVALVREQVGTLRVAAPERTIHLHAPEEAGTPIPVEVDADRIAQVVMTM